MTHNGRTETRQERSHAVVYVRLRFSHRKVVPIRKSEELLVIFLAESFALPLSHVIFLTDLKKERQRSNKCRRKSLSPRDFTIFLSSRGQRRAYRSSDNAEIIPKKTITRFSEPRVSIDRTRDKFPTFLLLCYSKQ